MTLGILQRRNGLMLHFAACIPKHDSFSCCFGSFVTRMCLPCRYDVIYLQSAIRARHNKCDGYLLPRTTWPCHLHQSQRRLSGRLERLQNLYRPEHGCQDANASQEVQLPRGVLSPVRRGTGDVVDGRGEVKQASTDVSVTAAVLEGRRHVYRTVAHGKE